MRSQRARRRCRPASSPPRARARRPRRASATARKVFAEDIVHKSKATGGAAPRARIHAGGGPGTGPAGAPRAALRGARPASSTPATGCTGCTPCANAPARLWWRRCTQAAGRPAPTCWPPRGRASSGRIRRTASSEWAWSGPTARMEHIACDVLLLACNGFGGNAVLVRELLRDARRPVRRPRRATTAAPSCGARHWARGWPTWAAYQGHGSWVVPQGRADDLGRDDGRRRAAQCARAALPRRDAGLLGGCGRRAGAAGRIAWNVFGDPQLALAREFPDFRDAEAAGALRTAADRGAGGDHRLRRGRAGSSRSTASALPFHAVRVTGALFHTQGGLDIDERCRVRRSDGGLFPQPAGRRRCRARRQRQRRVGLPVRQRPAQRHRGRLDRRPHGRRAARPTKVIHAIGYPEIPASAPACPARAGRVRRAQRADRRTGRLRGAVPLRRLHRLHAPGPLRRRPDHGERGGRHPGAHHRPGAPAGDRRRRHRLRQCAERAAHRARLRTRRRGDDPAGGPGLSQALRAPGRQDRGSGGGDVRQAARGPGCAPQQRHADPRAHRCAGHRRTRGGAGPGGALPGHRRRRPLHRGAAQPRADARGLRASRRASRCWPTWWKAARRRS